MGYNSYTNKNDPTTVGTSLEDGNGYGYPPNGTNLRHVLGFMEEQGASFVCNAGDITNIGFYFNRGDTDLYPYQFQEYRDILALYPNLSVYNIMGNHESYNADITTNLNELEEYLGTREIAYYFEQDNDVFIMVGQSTNTKPMTDDHFLWLQDKLERFKDRRCFVFVHSFIDDNKAGGVSDSGNPCFARNNSIFGMSGTYNTFINMMKQYDNTVLFHGHSHMKFESQKFDKDANYTEKNGFKSIHIPSLGDPRTMTNASGAWEEDKYSGQFCIIDVYDDYIVLNGYYIYREDRSTTTLKIVPIPLGTYKIET
jgi:hypothetical protein